MRKGLISLLVALALIAVGCGRLQVAGTERVAIGRAYTVDPQIEWSAASQGNRDVWTVDGLTLQAVHFIKGVRKGWTLLGNRGAQNDEWPTFDPGMTPHESLEFIVASLSRFGLANVEPYGLRPQPFGQAQGFRFDFDFLYPDGLEGRGLAAGAVIDDRLQLILYVGARQHYFPEYLDEVEAIIASIENGADAEGSGNVALHE